MSKGTNFDSNSVYKLVMRWEKSMESLIRGDEQIYESLVRMYQQEELETVSWGAIDSASFEYILKTISFLLLVDQINLRNLSLVIPDNKFASDALQVINLGEDIARQINLFVIGTEELLWGLVAEDVGVVSQILIAAGANAENIRYQIVQIIGERPPLPSEMPMPEKIPFVPRAKRVIELALVEANQMGQVQINSGHLLLGIIKQMEEEEVARKIAIAQGEEKPMEFMSVAVMILREKLGIDLVELEQQLRLAMSQ